MGTDSSAHAVVVSPEWELGPDSPAPDSPKEPATGLPWATLGMLVFLVGGLVVSALRATDDVAPVQPITPVIPSTSSSSTTPSTLPSAPGTRAFAQFDGQVLGVALGASLVSTDFDGRLFALDLDSGVLTRSQIRTGNFVTVGGRLVIQTGCGGWQVIELPSFAVHSELIECSSFLPLGRLGAETLLFADEEPSGDRRLLVDDGDGGLTMVDLANRPDSTIATVSDGRVLLERAGEIAWIDPVTGSAEAYASGELVAASPAGVLWLDGCDDDSCRIRFGTPDTAQLLQFDVAPFASGQPARLNMAATRAVFFKPDGMLRIVTTETGHAREVPNPGLSAASATWSPDGLWLMETAGANIVALNTLNGQSLEFEGVPGVFSPGWIALPRTG